MQQGGVQTRNVSTETTKPIVIGTKSAQQWNVRGKVTSRCLWNACKALSLGLLLMFIGGTMATVGYFADQLSIKEEIRGNSTVHIKNESRGFHLNNLSYAGPIVMGVGGFIVVAACVMTFEARDSAAKVVPARFKSKTSPTRTRADFGRRSTACQTRWDNLGVFRAVAHGATTLGLVTPLASALTSPAVTKASFTQFSRTIQSSIDSAGTRRSSISKCPSAPNLAALTATNNNVMTQFIRSPPLQQSVNASRKFTRRQSSSLKQACPLLTAHPLQQRQALSVDYTNYPLNFSPTLSQAKADTGSEVSMAMDLHLPDVCPVTLRVRDQSKLRLHQRSETARRHQLTRQKQIDETEVFHMEVVNGRNKNRTRHGSSKRQNRQKIGRSNTTCSGGHKIADQDIKMRRSFEDHTVISLTPSPERSCSSILQVHSNPASSTHSFEINDVQPSCSRDIP